MNEMVEQVAIAIHDEARTMVLVMSEGAARRLARAAIEAMREPTDEMCDAADWQQQSEVIQYQLAIEAALS